MADIPRTFMAPCTCVERNAAMQEGKFIYVFERFGWMFTDDPPRTTTFEKAYLAGENHMGEPYLWVISCPFCGRDMQTPPSPYLQGDGCDGEDGG